MKIPNLETSRLLLKKVVNEDQQNIYRGLSHPEVIKYYGVSYSTFKETEEQMRWYSNLEKSGAGRWWSIRVKETEEFCGAIGINDHHPEHNKAEIGFWLLPQFWGRGLIQEAAESLIHHLFEDLKLNRLEAYVEAANSKSSRVLEKLGFIHEGTMRDSEIKNGEFIDVKIYARLNR
ncbi:GNAT family N-acetyltransferase [Gramella sp. GC03-9]|uniref:GNAT family N-acetyltransferase n=1 Tax=Christiangramia oceanisediminis TaxID=2920386 RepID=A0A9X2KYL2_9FLAO|nr:GNAT family protein [Gramella oceanisediminis]MCP9200773.1 GNAT family N-acetyltransferase [Gramella oceanisediminis]